MSSRKRHMTRKITLTLVVFLSFSCESKKAPSPATTQSAKPEAPQEHASHGANRRRKDASGKQNQSVRKQDTPDVKTNDAVPQVDLSALADNMKKRIKQLQQRCREAPSNTKRLEALAAAYASIDRTSAAAACFDRAAAIIPNNFRFHYLGGLLHVQSGDPVAARREFERAAAIDPKYAPVHTNLGRLLLDQNPIKAREQFEKAKSLDATDEVAWWGLGKCDQKAGNHKEAIRCFQRALDILPNYGDAQEAAAESYRALGNESAAKSLMKRHDKSVRPSIDNDPVLVTFKRVSSSDEELIELAMQHARAGDLRRAIQILGASTMMGRDGAAIRKTLGTLFLEQGETNLAIDEFTRALKFKPDSPELHSLIAGAHMELGQLAEAQSHLETAQSLAPNDANVMSAVATLMLAQGKTAEAEDLFQKAIAQAPDNPVVLYRASKASLAAGKVDTAIERLSKCIKVAPDHSPARYELALVLLKTGKREKGLAQLRQIVTSGQAYPKAYLTLAVVAKQGDKKTAELLRKGLAKSPQSPALANGLAWILATTPDSELRDPTQAVALATLACKLAPRPDFEYLDTLSAAQAANGSYELAARTLAKAIQLAESSHIAPERLKQYRERLNMFQNKQAYVRPSE